MDCPSCGHENPDDAVFCGECAASLAQEVECPSCRRRNPPGQKFCHGCASPLTAPAPTPVQDREPRSYTPKHLADKILQSKSALEGERKQVTVLFADVKGSMELAEDRSTPRSGTDPRSLLPDPDRRACTASRAPSTSTRATASWRCSARRLHTRITHSAPATPRSTCANSFESHARELQARARTDLLGAHGSELGRRRRRQDR